FRPSLERWVDYFETDREKVLCGFLLDSLVFRTGLQTKALLANLIDKTISQALVSTDSEVVKNILHSLKKPFPGVEKGGCRN
ncbi:hypothetical protein, partial [Pseudomonas amygdali]|uniref:hypothetical protein n=1 Tax=Pseudomonas amygdali TaxID=47877 RepID=UPI001F2FD3CD